MPGYDEVAGMLLGICDELGMRMSGAKVLDYGCGRGDLVRCLRRRGVEAYGADLVEPSLRHFAEQHLAATGEGFGEFERAWRDGRIGPDTYPQRLADGNVGAHDDANGWLKTMTGSPPRLPFDDETFDLVISTSVFEHVLDYRAAFKEIHRVTKPGGHSLHAFPPRWSVPVEPHIRVPIGGILHSRWWLSLWALLGVRAWCQTGMSWRETVAWNEAYYRSGLHYQKRADTNRIVEDIFGNIDYPTREYVRHSPGRAARLGRRLRIPFWGSLLFSFREQMIHMTKQS